MIVVYDIKVFTITGKTGAKFRLLCGLNDGETKVVFPAKTSEKYPNLENILRNCNFRREKTKTQQKSQTNVYT